MEMIHAENVRCVESTTHATCAISSSSSSCTVIINSSTTFPSTIGFKATRSKREIHTVRAIHQTKPFIECWALSLNNIYSASMVDNRGEIKGFCIALKRSKQAVCLCIVPPTPGCSSPTFRLGLGASVASMKPTAALEMEAQVENRETISFIFIYMFTAICWEQTRRVDAVWPLTVLQHACVPLRTPWWECC